MKKLLVLAICLAVAAPAFAAGIDLSANNICPGVAGGSSDGGPLDCAALAGASKNVRIYGSFVPAEAISDLGALDGQVTISILGDLNAEGSFWNGYPGACLDANGGGVKFIGAKPQNGDPCGTSLAMREVFADGGANTANPPYAGNSSIDYFFTVFKAGTVSVTTSNRIFGFELRLDPAYSSEAGGPCGSCNVPVAVRWVKATPGSSGGSPTTVLSTGTGFAGVGPTAVASGGGAVLTKARTWGQLKSLYR